MRHPNPTPLHSQREGPAAEEEETALHKEARALWAALSTRLDSLSHFHFAPKPVVEELSIKHEVPALTMEEVAPVSFSAGDHRAPQVRFSPTATKLQGVV
jgi:U3 small nucleolar RNA-associated protein MPP10